MTSTDTPLRLVSVERLSFQRDNSTGIERQDQGNERYAKAYGHTIVKHVADTDVSGNVPMWKRPKAGPWVNDAAKRMTYDGFIFSALDRLGRNARHISWMRDWAEDHGKVLIITSPPLQWPPAEGDVAGPIIWDVMARLAEYELYAITKRNRETLAYLRANKSLSSWWPYGYTVMKVGEGKTLVPDEETAENVLQMFKWRLEGKTLLEIAAALDSLHLPTPRDLIAEAKGNEPPRKGWHRASVAAILANPIYKGTRTDDTGNVILRVPPIVDNATWHAAQKIGKQTGERSSGRRTLDKALLAGVIKCGVCGGNMSRISANGKRSTDGKRDEAPRYYCRGTDKTTRCGVSTLVSEAEAYVSEQVAGFGDEPHFVQQINPGEVFTDEIDEIESQIQTLALSEDDDAVSRIVELRAQRKELLAKQEAEESRYVDWVPAKNADGTIKTVADVWRETEGDTAARRKFLLDRGCELHVIRERGKGPDGKSYNRVKFSIGFNTWSAGQPQAAAYDYEPSEAL
jgi:DNA invertase Pin-like site-specific DNA recombinase